MQRKILEELHEVYPRLLHFHTREDFNDPDFQGNLSYLLEHGLIEGNIDKPPGSIFWAKITVAGLDYLEDDGGHRASG